MKKNRKDGGHSCFRPSSIRRSASPGLVCLLLLSLHHHHDFPVTNTSTFFTPSGQAPLFPTFLSLEFDLVSLASSCKFFQTRNQLQLSLSLFWNFSPLSFYTHNTAKMVRLSVASALTCKSTTPWTPKVDGPVFF